MNSTIQKMVDDLRAQIADLETIDLIIDRLEEMATDEASPLYEWTYGRNGEVTAKLTNPRAPQIVAEIVGAIKDFYMLVEPPKELHDTDNNDKHEVLIITPKEA